MRFLPIFIFLTVVNCGLAQSDSWMDQIDQLQKQALRASRQMMDSIQKSSVSGTSMRMEETNDEYRVELSLLNRQAAEIEVTRKGGNLVFAAPAKKEAPAYEQSIPVPNAAREAQPKIKRDGEKLTVTLARDAAAPVTTQRMNPWTDDGLARLQQMQQQMDRMFGSFFGGASGGPTQEKKATIEEDGDAYVIRVSAAEAIAKNLDITVENNQLRLDSKSDSSAPSLLNLGTPSGFHEVVELPGPVETSGMTVQPSETGLIIRLPKARA